MGVPFREFVKVRWLTPGILEAPLYTVLMSLALIPCCYPMLVSCLCRSEIFPVGIANLVLLRWTYTF